MRHPHQDQAIEPPQQRRAALAFVLTLGMALSGCAGDDRADFAISRAASSNPVQPYPGNYRADLVAFLRTYLNDPRGIREAALAEPSQREVRGRKLYIACLRYNARGPDGVYPGASERAVVFVDGRLDRLIEDGKEFCTGSAYQPFPEMEKLAR